MRMFCNFSRKTPPQAPVRLLMNFVLIYVWCGTFCASSISMLSIGRECRLLAPVITFVEISLCVGLCGRVQRSLNLLQLYFLRMRPASPGKRFATPTNRVLAETNPHAAFVHCHHQQRFVHEFWIWPSVLTNSQVHRFTSFWWKRYQNCWRKFLWDSGETRSSGTTGLRLISHATSENIPPQLRRIDVSGGADLCLGLLGQRTAHHWTSSYGTIRKTLFAHRQFIPKRILLPLSLRQQQPSGRNLASLKAHHLSLSWSVTIVLNIHSKVVK